MKIIEPSLLSINKENARKQLEQIKNLGIKYVHYDVMDGQFVPPTSFTTEYLKDLEELGILPNVHLMVKDVSSWIEKYKDYKVNSITFHVETQSIEKGIELIDKIHRMGCSAGVAVKPETDLNKYIDLVAHSDIILIMSVNPGWGGQGFMDEALNNLNKATQAKIIYPNLTIEIDGGINFNYIKKLYGQVDWFVTGSWFFKNIDNFSQYLDEFNKLKN